MARVKRAFFARDTVTVARDLLGRHLVHVVGDERVAGRIVETEAYTGFEDRASHGRHGKTARNAVMFGPVGVSYVYFTYGMHWLLNVVARPKDADYPAAVLLRAIEPVGGVDFIAARRNGRPPKEWTNGPAKLTQALAIDGSHSGLDMTAKESLLYIEEGDAVPDPAVEQGPRVGLGKTPEPWFSIPWRFFVAGNPNVSRYR